MYYFISQNKKKEKHKSEERERSRQNPTNQSIKQIIAMVVSLGPGKFYGSSLPRPRIYTDVKLNETRVDPPVSVVDPFLSWANEAHWSMGGLSFKRLRLQGKIEGNIQKLRKESEVHDKKMKKLRALDEDETPRVKGKKGKRGVERSPPGAPRVMSKMRTRAMAAVRGESGDKRKKRLVRKLGDDFEKVVVGSEKGGSEEAVTVAKAGRWKRRNVVLAEESECESESDEEEIEEDVVLTDESEISESENEDEEDVFEFGCEELEIGEKGKGKGKRKEKKKGEVSGSGSTEGRRSSPRLKKMV